MLVLALHPAGSIVMPDYYIIPIDDTSGAIVGAAELALNPTHTAVQLTSIIARTPAHAHGHMPYMAQSTAQADVAGQQHVALKSGAQPSSSQSQLMRAHSETGQVTWTGGGLYPADPIWLIPGADGQNHIVGTDGRSYNMSSVPVMKQP